MAYNLENKILALKDFNTVIDSSADTDIGEIAKGIIDLEHGQNLSSQSRRVGIAHKTSYRFN
jgi:hypothetical protein